MPDSDHNPLCMEFRWDRKRKTTSGPLFTKEVVPSNSNRRLKWDKVACQENILTSIGVLVASRVRNSPRSMLCGMKETDQILVESMGIL